MSDESEFRCVRCERTDASPVESPPFDNEAGRRVAEEICLHCWEEWKQRQMLLINHYALNLRDADARRFLMENMEAFLFGEGDGEAEIDTSLEGTVGPGGV